MLFVAHDPLIYWDHAARDDSARMRGKLPEMCCNTWVKDGASMKIEKLLVLRKELTSTSTYNYFKLQIRPNYIFDRETLVTIRLQNTHGNVTFNREYLIENREMYTLCLMLIFFKQIECCLFVMHYLITKLHVSSFFFCELVRSTRHKNIYCIVNYYNVTYLIRKKSTYIWYKAQAKAQIYMSPLSTRIYTNPTFFLILYLDPFGPWIYSQIAPGPDHSRILNLLQTTRKLVQRFRL